MKKFVLKILISAFVFIVVHDYVIAYFDSDTQSELILAKKSEISDIYMCDLSKTHQYLHESLICINPCHNLTIKDIHLKKDIFPSVLTILAYDLINQIYKPPIS